MLAAYVDLPKLGLRKFSPFIGGGIGAARVAIGEMRMTFPKTTTIVPGTSRTGLTWMLTAGLGISLAEQTTLDLAWRYTDYGVIETGEGKGRVEWRDGSRELRRVTLQPAQGGQRFAPGRATTPSFAERRPGSIGHITLRGKCAGARSAGKPHAACDVAGAGNGLTVRLVRHSHRKRGETDRPRLRSTAPALDPTAVDDRFRPVPGLRSPHV